MGFYPPPACSDLSGAALDADVHAAAVQSASQDENRPAIIMSKPDPGLRLIQNASNRPCRCKRAPGAQGWWMEKITRSLVPSSTSSVAPFWPRLMRKLQRGRGAMREKEYPRGCDDELWLEAERQLCRSTDFERKERDRSRSLIRVLISTEER